MYEHSFALYLLIYVLRITYLVTTSEFRLRPRPRSTRPKLLAGEDDQR